MVVDLDEVGTGLEGERADRLFHALADATRRDILARAMAGDLSVSDLARLYPVSFAAIQKHVAVLERAGLVVKHRQGRRQLVQTDLTPIEESRRLLEQLEARWRQRIGAMEAVLALPDNNHINPSVKQEESNDDRH